MVASVRDVAALAGVSPSTVSNYLHRPHLLSQTSAERVAAAITALGYVPNESARQLRKGASRTLALILLDAWLPFYADLARGVEDELNTGDWSLFFANSRRNDAREINNLAMFEAHRVQGIIINPKGDIGERLEELQRRGIVCVAMSPVAVTPSVSSVAFDDFRGGQLAGQHLIELGRRHIAFIGDSLRITHSARRLEGLRDAADTCGQQVGVFEVPVASLDMRNGIAAAEGLLALDAKDRPDAIFASNDMLALGTMTALVRAGCSIPDDVAIVGYDDIDLAERAIVPLTTIRQPAYDMGKQAAAMLLRRLANPDAPAEHVSFDVQLVPRASTLGSRP